MPELHLGMLRDQLAELDDQRIAQIFDLADAVCDETADTSNDDFQVAARVQEAIWTYFREKMDHA